jgi:hypothetical protein
MIPAQGAEVSTVRRWAKNGGNRFSLDSRILLAGSREQQGAGRSPRAARRRDMPEEIRLGNRSLVVMVILTVAMGGIYPVVWFYRTKRQLDPVATRARITKRSLRLAVVLLLASLTSAISLAIAVDSEVSRQLLSWMIFVNTAVELGFVAVLIYLAFVVRGILMNYCHEHLHDDVAFSGLATFLLGAFYLQYKMNRMPA